MGHATDPLTLARADLSGSLEKRDQYMNDAANKAMDWLRIVRGEYLEMPGLQLTQSQARRMWGLDEQWCAVVLSTLVGERFLRLTSTGRYARNAA